MKKVIALAVAGLFALSAAAYAGAGAKSSADAGYGGGCAWGAKQTASTPAPVETAQTPVPKPETKPGG